MPDFTRDALAILRDPHHFQWSAVVLLGLVFYVYGVEVERKNWSAVLAGLAFWSVDWLNEVAKALVLHFTGYSAIWTTTGTTSFQITVGLTYEIAVLFAISGIIFTKFLPADRKARLLGLPNRWVYVIGFSLFSVFVEVLLNRTGSFHWAYRWWGVPHVELIVVFGYGTFYAAAAWVYDLDRLSSKIKVAGSLAGAAATAIVVFGPLLRWI